MRVLVSGACGKLGKRVCLALARAGHRVLALDRAGCDKAGLPSKTIFIPADIIKPETLSRVREADAVVHLAALVDYSAPFPRLMQVNALGTQNLLAATRGRARFIHISSISVYGNRPRRVPLDEHATALHPTSDYGESKLASEHAVVSQSRRLATVILRPALIYGPGFEDEYFKIFRLLEHGSLRVLGNGENELPFVHVDDVAGAILAALDTNILLGPGEIVLGKTALAMNITKKPGKLPAFQLHVPGKKARRPSTLASRQPLAVIQSGAAFNISGPDQPSQKQILKIAAQALKVPVPEKTVPVPLAKLGADAHSLLAKLSGKPPKLLKSHIDKLSVHRPVSIQRANQQLNWTPKVRLPQGIEQMVKEYKKNNKRK